MAAADPIYNNIVWCCCRQSYIHCEEGRTATQQACSAVQRRSARAETAAHL